MSDDVAAQVRAEVDAETDARLLAETVTGEGRGAPVGVQWVERTDEGLVVHGEMPANVIVLADEISELQSWLEEPLHADADNESYDISPGRGGKRELSMADVARHRVIPLPASVNLPSPEEKDAARPERTDRGYVVPNRADRRRRARDARRGRR